MNGQRHLEVFEKARQIRAPEIARDHPREAAPVHLRSLAIEADRVYFDARGKLLGDLDKADPKRAKAFREDNFRWTWTP